MMALNESLGYEGMSLARGFRFMEAVESSFSQESEMIAEFAVVPVLKVLCMGSLGTLLAHPRVDLIKPTTTKLLSKLVFALFLPCLIFTELGASVTFENMVNWWFIPVNVVVSTCVGFLVGLIVVLVCHPPRRFFRFVVAMTGVGNTGNIPLAIIGSMCHSKNAPFGSRCKQDGVAYVALSTWISVILIYLVVYHLLEPPEFQEESDLVDDDEEAGGLYLPLDGKVEEDEEIENADGRRANGSLPQSAEGRAPHPSVLEAEWPGLKMIENENFRRPCLWRGISMTSQGSALSDDEDVVKRVACMKTPRVMRRLRIVAERTPLEHLFQPPLVASFLAIAVGLFPKSKGVLFGDDAPLGFVDDSFEILAMAMVPCIMLVLGGSLSGGPGKSELGLKTTVGVCVARLVVMPLIGIVVVALGSRLGMFPVDNQMFKFVLFLQYTMPSALLCGAMASLRGYGESEAGALMFWQHILAVFSITFYIAIYLNLLSYT